MRKLIAAMKASLDGKIERTDGNADWVRAWSDDYGLTPQIDACMLGGGMYPVREVLDLDTDRAGEARVGYQRPTGSV